MERYPLVVVGGGPAGLAAAWEATSHGRETLVLEKSGAPGGIARTESYQGFRFDMGGHRFFSKSDEINRLWRQMLAEDLLQRPRLSRIYYRGRFFHYPLKALNALLGLGLVESALILLSYVRWRLFPYRQEHTLEQWVTNRFGRRLFRTFFKSYTEKVWGIPCSELRAEWAAQRIKNLSLRSALLGMFFRSRRQRITTLIGSFLYPRLGPGMLWEACARQVEQRGGTIRLDSEVQSICRRGSAIESMVVGCNGQAQRIYGRDFISSMPLAEFIAKLDPPAPPDVREAAARLAYRAFLTVGLVIRQPDLFPDNWIYVHDPQVKVGRIQNYKNWSPDMVPDASRTGLGMEYFCNEGDELWCMDDAALVAMAKRELERIGLARQADVEAGCVFRVPKAYPVYDSTYPQHLQVVRRFMDSLENCRTIGRNGLHRYNNQDHSMLTGIHAVRDLLSGRATDLWRINGEQEYHEEREDRSAPSAHSPREPQVAPAGSPA